MKLVIMIPCLNEEKTLPVVLKGIPQKISGIDDIEVLVIDDGSTDKTVEIAKKHGVTQFIRHAKNKGLAHSFRDGLEGALERGADIIVLTDGDNQYPQERIPDLIQPILDGTADTVIADRHTQEIAHFSPFKKFLQRFGTRVLNVAAGTNVPDATSGFRAFSKEAAFQLNLVNRYSFGMETLVQHGRKRHAIGVIDIKTNPKTRESRLMKSSLQHARKNAIIIIRSYVMYSPLAVFVSLGAFFLIVGLLPFIHYIFLFFTVRNPNGAHHLQSLIIGTVLLTASFISFTLGIVADMIRINRSLIEDTLEIAKRDRFNILNRK